MMNDELKKQVAVLTPEISDKKATEAYFNFLRTTLRGVPSEIKETVTPLFAEMTIFIKQKIFN